MSIRIGRRLQIAAVCALIAAYAGLSHYCNAHSGDGARSLGAALALAPLLIVVSALLWRSAGPLIALILAVLGAAMLGHYWPLLEGNFSKVYLLQECSVWGLLAYGFGRSLGAGGMAVCTQLADKVHGPLTARELRYTRQVTAAWACFFGVITALSLGLYLAAPLRTWSLFVNFATLPLVAAMFAAEYAVRRRVLPQADRSGILATVRVFLASSR